MENIFRAISSKERLYDSILRYNYVMHLVWATYRVNSTYLSSKEEGEVYQISLYILLHFLKIVREVHTFF